MYKFLTCCLIGLSFLACNSSTSEQAAKQPNTAANEVPAGEIIYPSIVQEEMKVLVEKTTLVDFIFYHQDFSMNLDNKPAIMNALRQISEAPAPIRPECKPMGRVIYQGNGEILKEADFYFEYPCFYFVFIEDDKPVKANMMTEEGAKFFKKLLSGVSVQ